jgi:hypothetical protein
MARGGAAGTVRKRLIQRNSGDDVELETEKRNRHLQLVHDRNVKSTNYLIKAHSR